MHTTDSDDRVILKPLTVECDCGKVIRIAHGWTAFRCSHCRKVLGYGPEQRPKRSNFIEESAGVVDEASV